MPDHVHMLMNCKPNMNLSNNVRDIKEHSTKFINNKVHFGRFYWEEGFGAFTVSKQNVPFVLNYVKNQEFHHKKTTFKEEYLLFLEENEIEYKPEYLFDFDL